MAARRIAIAGNYRNFSTTLGLANGFEALGWTVHRIDLADHFAAGSRVIDKVLYRVNKHRSIKNYNDAILRSLKTFNPDVFLAVKGAYIDASTLDAIANAGIPSLNYYPDAHFSHDGVDENNFVRCHYVWTTKSYQLDYLKNRIGSEKVGFLHHGYVTAVHCPPLISTGPAPLADVVYVGNHTADKEQWLAALKRKRPDLELLIYGNRWDSAATRRLFGRSIVGGPIAGPRYAEAIFRAKINLGIHMGITDRSGWQDLVSTRTFEIPACKGFMLHVDNGEIRSLFEPGAEIDVFSSVDELSEKIDYYLAHEKIRWRMAEKAYRRCVPAYSYDDRARVIGEWITSNRS